MKKFKYDDEYPIESICLQMSKDIEDGMSAVSYISAWDDVCAAFKILINHDYSICHANIPIDIGYFDQLLLTLDSDGGIYVEPYVGKNGNYIEDGVSERFYVDERCDADIIDHLANGNACCTCSKKDKCCNADGIDIVICTIKDEEPKSDKYDKTEIVIFDTKENVPRGFEQIWNDEHGFHHRTFLSFNPEDVNKTISDWKF